MGRPREHNEETRGALLDAAERIVADHGVGSLSVRAVADSVGTTTRAVYSLFGAKDGLLSALADRVFEMLRSGVESLPETDDPAADLVEAALQVFRRLAVEHPALYRLAFQQLEPEQYEEQTFETRRRAMVQLVRRFERLAGAGLLGGREPRRVALHFHALCEGMAAMEVRSSPLIRGDPEATWREAFTILVYGLRVPAASPPSARAAK